MPSARARKRAGNPGFHALVLRGECMGKDCGRAVEAMAELNRSPTLLCQAVRAEFVAGEEHAMHAARLALNAIFNGESRSRRKELEFLLWLSGKRQLEKALQAFGLRGGKGEKVFVVAASLKSKAEAKNAAKRIAGELKLKETARPKPRSEAETAAQMLFYGITRKMLGCFPGEEMESALEKLVLEKIALLALEG